MKQQILKDIGGSLILKYYINGIQRVPSSAKITLYNNLGSVIQEQVAVTSIDPLSGTMSFTVTPEKSADLGENYKAVWEFVYNGETLYEQQLYEVVLQILTNPIKDIDIINRAPYLKDLYYSVIGLASSGSTTTIVYDSFTEETGYWDNSIVEITDGTNEGAIRRCIDYQEDTKTMTLDTAYPIDIDSTSRFKVTKSFDKESSEAFDMVLDDLRLKGIRSNLVISNEQIRELVLIKTLYLICFNLSKDPVDIWFERANKFENNYDNKFQNITFDYDKNEDGKIEDDEKSQQVTQTKAVR